MGFGSGSCFLQLAVHGDPRKVIWPATLYLSSGTIEIVFQHLRLRPPFDTTEAREALRQEFNRTPGIQEIPADALERRPSIQLATLTAPATLTGFLQSLDWFVERVREFEASLTTP